VEVEMGMLSFCLGMRRHAIAAKDTEVKHTDIPMISRGESYDSPQAWEPPLSFSDLIAASSFLDFGGTLDERWLSGRAPEQRDAGRRRK
jgi:hypothetical protein